MICLSYSLFGDPSSFEFPWYLRGVAFNVRMNEILYPEITTMLFIDSVVAEKHGRMLQELKEVSHFQIVVDEYTNQRCKGMFRRLMPLFFEESKYSPKITHVICRDLDSVSTYREALCTYEWLQSGLPYHAINDNAAHGGLMGGMVAFKSEDFKKDTGYKSFEQMIKGVDLKLHGSDQNFMNRAILPKIKGKLFLHNLKGAGCPASVVKTEVPASGPIDKKLWTSDLISRYIGSAGVIDFELLRWFKAHDPNPKWDAFEKRYSDIFYWAR
jgi:hypothetical protein